MNMLQYTNIESDMVTIHKDGQSIQNICKHLTLQLKKHIFIKADVLRNMISQGSTSTVWIAKSKKLADIVAIKIYRSHDYEEIARQVSELSDMINSNKSNRSK